MLCGFLFLLLSVFLLLLRIVAADTYCAANAVSLSRAFHSLITSYRLFIIIGAFIRFSIVKELARPTVEINHRKKKQHSHSIQCLVKNHLLSVLRSVDSVPWD